MASEDGFDEIMAQVGNSGKFQKIYNVIFNFFGLIIATMSSIGIIIALTLPDHWCKVPQEHSNFSVSEWKNLTIPWTGSYSKCTMYNSSGHITECQFGWEYDTTYFKETIPTQENWVCDQEMYVTNFLALSKIGEILGTALVQLGDIYGRRPIFLLSILTLAIGRLGLLISSGSFLAFGIFVIIGNLSMIAIAQAPLIISMEMSSIEDRTSTTLLQTVAYTIGLSFTALIFMLFNNWQTFTLIVTLPLIPFLFIQPFMIESPRWLATRGKHKKCLQELRKIARFNNTEISDKILILLQKQNNDKEKVYSMLTLFSSWKLAKKTLLVITGWVCYMLIYLILVLNATYLEGNPFTNFFWQGIAELPGYFLGKYLSDTRGRRLSKTAAFLGLAIFSFTLCYVILTSNHAIMILICGISLKFLSSIVYYTTNLQTLEIYPTCLRQTGCSIGFLFASIFGIFTPYVIYLGTAVNASIPYLVTGILALIGGITGFFLPETLNQKLPETISDAEGFGEDQRFFNFCNRKSEHHAVSTDED